MSHKCFWSVGLIILLACSASYWVGQHFGGAGEHNTATTHPGALPMTDDPQSNGGDAPEASDDELACRLTPDELNTQRKQLIPGLFQRAERVEDIPTGLRFRFSHQPKLVTDLAALIEKERVCCSFLSFRLITEKGEGPITLEVTGPPGTAEMLRKL
jgi:hypothetical protein